MEAIEFVLNGKNVSKNIKEITDLLLLEANKFIESQLKDYENKFRDADFKYLNKTDKINLVRREYADLKFSAFHLKTWNDPAELRNDLEIAVEKSIDIIDNKNVILEKWNKSLLYFAIFLLLVNPKKEYLARMLDRINKEETTEDAPDYMKMSVGEILKRIFNNYTDKYLEPVENYIANKEAKLDLVPKLSYTGIKKTLYENFNQIVSKGYDRHNIVLLISEKVEWRSDKNALPEKLDYDDVIKRIYAIPPKMG